MIFFLLFAQIASASAPRADSNYSSPALRALVQRAANENRLPPADLRSYKSSVETELSLLIRDTLGREQSAQIEQIAASATWSRGDSYNLHILGYRSQNIGVPYSALTLVRAWTVPTLYGERLSLGAYFAGGGRAQNDSLIIVHPFAADRDTFYRFSGGDTVATLRAMSRVISVVRVHVEPVSLAERRLAAFAGEIDLDAERGQIIRMRGRFLIAGGQPNRRQTLAQRIGVVTAAYVEFTNAEIDGKYWLPTSQRTEFQASFPIFGQTRPIFRLVSSIAGIVANDSVLADSALDDHPRISVAWARSDSVDAFAEWRHDLGSLSGSVHADDFNDIAPDAWRTSGAPRFDFFPSTLSRILRFNRIEGVFTGVAPALNFRSLVPGLTVGGSAGWAWSEQTFRGGGFASYRTARQIYGIRVERALNSTNDFVPPLTDDPGFSALLGSIDDYDYVDRRSAMMSATQVFGSISNALATVEAAVESDATEIARISRGVFPSSQRFRPNRGVENGTSLRMGAELEIHPNVNGDFVQPGLGSRLRYDFARGDLDWSRIEGRVSAREYVGRVTLGAQADAGMVFGARLPPQRLFELGGNESLAGYEYKEFVGDRAALFRMFASYRLGMLQRPWRFSRGLMLPGLSPGLAASLQGGWSELSSKAAVAAAARLTAGTPLQAPTPTNGIRATAGIGVTAFSDLVHVGVARAVDRRAPLRFVAGFGTAF